ncbi:DMT family transporter [Geodermatophilus maliterrae]|uniref:DMT family transporter n=1 Tax=Geodermatophilus maliterrae TaxID=3162531 RepID=A0ABV3XDQ2_9ACTN
MTDPGRSRLQRLGVPALFVLLWSTGFVGAQYGLPYAEPLTFLGLRMVIAASLLALLALALRAAVPARPAQYGHSAAVGLLLHAGYLGGVFVAISLGTPAGVSAVVVSLQPVLTVVLAGRVLGERTALRQWLGLALGVAGVVVVVWPGLTAAAGRAGALSTPGLLACLVALASGTAGTVYQKRYGAGVPLLWGTAVQYAAAAAVLLLGAVATERMTIRWTGDFVLAMVWLVLALSLGAVLLLMLLLRRGTAAEVSSLFYLVPPAVALEAWLLFGVVPPPVSLAGVAVTALGVALVVAPRRRPVAVG